MAEPIEVMFETTTSAPPEQVWGLLGDPSTYREWWADWHSATASEMPLRAGGHITMHQVDHDPDKGHLNDVRELNNYRMPITVCEAPHRLYIRNQSLGTEDFCFDLQPVEGGTRIVFRRIANVPRMMRFLGKAMEGRLRGTARESVLELARLAELRAAVRG